MLEMQYFSKQIRADLPRSDGPGSGSGALCRQEVLGGSAELVRAGQRCGPVARGSISPPRSYDNGESSFDWRFGDQPILLGKSWSGASEDISLCWK